MRVGLDTNILAYAEGVNDAARRDAALALIRGLPADTVVPAQVLGELFNVLVRKAGRSRENARSAVLDWRDAFSIQPTAPETLAMAVDLATQHQLGIWDSVILAAAAQAGCRLLLSEDLRPGFRWGGVMVVDPFATPASPELEALMRDMSDGDASPARPLLYRSPSGNEEPP